MQKLYIRVTREPPVVFGGKPHYDLVYTRPITGEVRTRGYSAKCLKTAVERAPAQVVENMRKWSMNIPALNAWLSQGFVAVIEAPDGRVEETSRPPGIVDPEGLWTGDPLPRLPWGKR